MTLKTGVIAAENSALHHKNKLRYLRILFENSLSRELTAFLLIFKMFASKYSF